MTKTIILYLLPLIPLLMYLVLFGMFRTLMFKELPETMKEHRGYRDVSLTLVGIIFSISGVLGIFHKSIPELENIVLFYMVFCLITFLVIFFLQRFRLKFWHDIMSDCFLDTGLFLLILTLSAIIFPSIKSFPILFLIILAFIGWLLYVLFHLKNYASYLTAIKEAENE